MRRALVYYSVRANTEGFLVDRRLVIPDRRTLSGVMKIFVRTGPEYVGAVTCTEEALIEVDLVRPGELAFGYPGIEHRHAFLTNFTPNPWDGRPAYSCMS